MPRPARTPAISFRTPLHTPPSAPTLKNLAVVQPRGVCLEWEHDLPSREPNVEWFTMLGTENGGYARLTIRRHVVKDSHLDIECSIPLELEEVKQLAHALTILLERLGPPVPLDKWQEFTP